jgi:serpin B
MCIGVLAPVSVSAQSRRARRPEGVPGSGAVAVAEGSNRFAMDLYGKLRGERGNLFFSPYSISTALAMTYAGTRGNTATEMAGTLHFGLEPAKLHPAYRALATHLRGAGREGTLKLNVANRLWGQKGYHFLPAFLELTREDYGAGLQELDFAGAREAARKTINDWVEKETEGKIKDLIPPDSPPPLTRLILTNAIYFKSDWTHKFKKRATRDEPFWLSALDSVQVPTMRQTDTFGYGEDGALQLLEMSYVGGGQSMVVLLPKTRDGLAGLEEGLTADRLAALLKGVRSERVRVSLPKFKFTSQFSLTKALKAMGMRDAFDPLAADFTGMSDSPELYIGDVIHKAFVDVYEEGTEAAAATAVMMLGTAMPPAEPKVFQADHPFMFLIRDRQTGAIVFMGRVADPKG